MRWIRRWWWPLLASVVWLAGAGIGGPLFGRLAEVQSQSPTDFLPATAESTRALALQQAFSDDVAPPAILLFVDEAGIGDPARADLAARLEVVGSLPGVGAASPLIPSRERSPAGDPLALQAFVGIVGSASEVVSEIRAELRDAPPGITAYVTGPAGFVADLVAAFGEIDGLLLLVTVVAVLVILLIVYRSPVLPILVLLSAMAALSVAVIVVFVMAREGWITLNGQAQGILFILVIGAATDYALLLVSRYREALRAEADVLVAIRRAWRGAFEPILASGGTVIAGVMTLLLSDLNSNKALGPVAAAGIAVAMLAALTFLPALLALLGRGPSSRSRRGWRLPPCGPRPWCTRAASGRGSPTWCRAAPGACGWPQAWSCSPRRPSRQGSWPTAFHRRRSCSALPSPLPGRRPRDASSRRGPARPPPSSGRPTSPSRWWPRSPPSPGWTPPRCARPPSADRPPVGRPW